MAARRVGGTALRLAPLVIGMVLLAAACGAPPDGSDAPAPASAAPASPAPTDIGVDPGASDAPPPPVEPRPPSSAELIAAALGRGEITPEEAAVYRAFSAFGDERLPAAFRSDLEFREDHLALREAAGLWDRLSDEQRDALAPYFIPPIYAGSWADPEPEARGVAPAGIPVAAAGPAAVDPTACESERLRDGLYASVPTAGGAVRVWWRHAGPTAVRDGNLAATLAAEIESTIWPAFTGLMGRTPLSDAAVGCYHGEDGALDIYLTDVDLAAAALTIAYPGRCTATPAFIVVGAGTLSAPDFHPWKIAHEIFHAFQYAHGYGGPCAAFSDLDEASAMWAAEHVYPRVQFEWAGEGSGGYASWFRWNFESLFSHENAPSGYASWPLLASITHRHGVAQIPALYAAAEQVSSGIDALEVVTPGGLDGYWPQFVRDLWDDIDEFDVWRTWDPGGWSSTAFAEDGSAIPVPRPGGGGILTRDSTGPTHLWIAPWDDAACRYPPGRMWGPASETSVRFECPIGPDADLPSRARYTARASVWGLGRQEHVLAFADEEWPRFISIEQPGLGRDDEHLSVQGYYRTRDGRWRGPLDWRTRDRVEFCRDEAAEDVDRVVILYGNSEVDGATKAHLAENYEIEVRDACPEGFEVTVSIEHDSFLHAGSWTLTGRLEPHDPTRTYHPDQPIDELVGTGTWSGSAKDPFSGRHCDGGQRTASGDGRVYLSGSRHGDRLVFGFYPDLEDLAATADHAADPPFFDVGVLEGPAEGGTETYHMVKMAEAECGEPWEVTVTVTVAPGGPAP